MAKDIYSITKKFPADERYGLIDQLRRATVSISANIAEGSGRSIKDFIHFLNMSRTSAYECIPLLDISMSQEYIDITKFQKLYQQIDKISAMISGLINALKKKVGQQSTKNGEPEL